jgi:hypothetical protein
MRHLRAAAFLAVAAAAASQLAAAETALTPRNSLVAPLAVHQAVTIEGVGCGVPASATVTLPPGAADARVRRPSVGARSDDASLTAVSVQGGAVTLTAAADGARVCDPAAESTPPASRPWSADFDVEVGFTQRVGVVHWDPDLPRARVFSVRPREVRVGFSAAARGVRWTRFGARKAVGVGRFRSLIPCAGGCGDDGTRLTVELTRPARCPGVTRPGHAEDAVFYAKIAFILRERLGVLRPGREWMSTRRTCPPAGTPPIPIR